MISLYDRQPLPFLPECRVPICKVFPTLATTGLWAVLEDSCAGRGLQILLCFLTEFLAKLQGGNPELNMGLIVSLQDLVIKLFGSWNDRGMDNSSEQSGDHQRSIGTRRDTETASFSLLLHPGHTSPVPHQCSFCLCDHHHPLQIGAL